MIPWPTTWQRLPQSTRNEARLHAKLIAIHHLSRRQAPLLYAVSLRSSAETHADHGSWIVFRYQDLPRL